MSSATYLCRILLADLRQGLNCNDLDVFRIFSRFTQEFHLFQADDLTCIGNSFQS